MPDERINSLSRIRLISHGTEALFNIWSDIIVLFRAVLCLQLRRTSSSRSHVQRLHAGSSARQHVTDKITGCCGFTSAQLDRQEGGFIVSILKTRVPHAPNPLINAYDVE